MDIQSTSVRISDLDFATLTDGCGRGPLRPAMVDLGWPRIRAVNESLAIDADTIA